MESLAMRKPGKLFKETVSGSMNVKKYWRQPGGNPCSCRQYFFICPTAGEEARNEPLFTRSRENCQSQAFREAASRLLFDHMDLQVIKIDLLDEAVPCEPGLIVELKVFILESSQMGWPRSNSRQISSKA